MISRLSRRSVLVALTVHSPTDYRTRPDPSCSGSPDDVDHEVQRVGPLDAGLGGALRPVAVLRRDREDHLGADVLADQGAVPALDHLAGPDLELCGRTLVEVLVERLAALVDLSEV